MGRLQTELTEWVLPWLPEGQPHLLVVLQVVHAVDLVPSLVKHLLGHRTDGRVGLRLGQSVVVAALV